jgi:hypothetical protein
MLAGAMSKPSAVSTREGRRISPSGLHGAL